jgi:hypothetical protein
LDADSCLLDFGYPTAPSIDGGALNTQDLIKSAELDVGSAQSVANSLPSATEHTARFR